MPHTKVRKDEGDEIPETVKTGTEKEKGDRGGRQERAVTSHIRTSK